MEHLLGEVKAHQPYSAIILDSSPVLLTSETKGLLPYIDTAILVVRARQTPRDLVLQAIKTLGEENLLGCLFNGVVASDFSSYHYYNSSAYYPTLSQRTKSKNYLSSAECPAGRPITPCP